MLTMEEVLKQSNVRFAEEEIVKGKVIEIRQKEVLVDIGYKSEGSVPRNEWEPHGKQPVVGDTVQVLVEEVENELGLVDDPHGMVCLSKSKAEKIIRWQEMMKSVEECCKKWLSG